MDSLFHFRRILASVVVFDRRFLCRKVGLSQSNQHYKFNFDYFGCFWRSIAVLPFKNEGCGLAGEYLPAGLTESITNRLSRLRSLLVMARHTVYSCHEFSIDPREVGQHAGGSVGIDGKISWLR